MKEIVTKRIVYWANIRRSWCLAYIKCGYLNKRTSYKRPRKPMMNGVSLSKLCSLAAYHICIITLKYNNLYGIPPYYTSHTPFQQTTSLRIDYLHDIRLSACIRHNGCCSMNEYFNLNNSLRNHDTTFKLNIKMKVTHYTQTNICYFHHFFSGKII